LATRAAPPRPANIPVVMRRGDGESMVVRIAAMLLGAGFWGLRSIVDIV
jgi:hypothetical protein